jgi:putative transposase
LRIEEQGGMYHVLNRGNYRQWIFREEGAKQAFEEALFECCERAGWLLHAFCLMGNHYHLAVETPQANLSEGVRWLQSVYANRFNRFHGSGGHLFQGRFKSLLVEDSQRMAWLCHYIHLNPVRAKICPVDALGGYRWSSLWYAAKRKSRPGFLHLETALEGAGGLTDTAAGWRKYYEYLQWLQEDQPARKQMAFERMSHGFAIGSKSFRQAVAADEKRLRSHVKLSQEEVRELREARWETALARAFDVLGLKDEELAKQPKSAAAKVAVAAWLKVKLMARNGWLAERLHMGAATGVSRYVGELLRQESGDAHKLYLRLTAKFKG